jgi:hypothetical protein
MGENSKHVVMDPANNNDRQAHCICLHCNEKMILPLPADMGRLGRIMVAFSKIHADCKKPNTATDGATI